MRLFVLNVRRHWRNSGVRSGRYFVRSTFLRLSRFYVDFNSKIVTDGNFFCRSYTFRYDVHRCLTLETFCFFFFLRTRLNDRKYDYITVFYYRLPKCEARGIIIYRTETRNSATGETLCTFDDEGMTLRILIICRCTAVSCNIIRAR